MRACLAFFLLFFFLTAPAFALSPDEVLKDPALESRAREISRSLRCLVCQSESIDDSNSDFAVDLRRLVRARLVAGDTDEQVISYIHGRYGDFVLLKPPFDPRTWVLWATPLLGVLAGLFLVIRNYFRRPSNQPSP